MIRKAAVAVLAVALGALVFATVASALVFSGQTDQGKRARVDTDKNNTPKRVRISWSAPCRNGAKFRSGTTDVAPFGHYRAGSFYDHGSYRQPAGSGLEAKVTATIDGHGTKTAWHGHFAAQVKVFRHGNLFTTCHRAKERWSATAR